MKKVLQTICIMLLAFNCMGCTESNTNIEENESVSVTTPKHTIMDDLTWEYYVSDLLAGYGYYPPADGDSTYLVTTIHLNNTGNETYSTKADLWVLTLDNVTYTHDMATYSELSDYRNVSVSPGGHIDFQIVYKIQDTRPGGVEELNSEPSLSYLG